MGRDEKTNREGREGGGGVKIVFLSHFYTNPLPQNKPKKKNDISQQHSKQAIRQGKLTKITKCLLTRFS